MRAEIITIGTEILLGQTVDSNSAWLGQQLNECGVQVERITSISDRPEAIVAALEAVPAHIDWILLTGGLGPTKDDLTKKVLCDYLKDYLIFRPEVYAHIEALFAGMGRVPNALNRPQAELPASAEVIQNTVGTAQGMLWTRGKQRILSMPGVPYEMKRIMEDGILPRMREERNEILLHRYVVVQGIPESDLAMRMEDWESALKPPLSLAYLPSPGLVKLRISVAGPSKQEEVLVQAISEAAASLKQLLGNDAYAEELVPLEKVIGQMLIERGQTLSTAESCTGGGIASRLTSVSGSSAYFQGAIVAYANVVKQAQLSVNPADLLLYGAVSEQVVRQMATGVRKHLKTDWSIATSGIAGPTGGSAEKPIGTVWIAVSGPGYSWAQCFQMGKDRSRVIEKSILASLNALRQGLATD